MATQRFVIAGEKKTLKDEAYALLVKINNARIAGARIPGNAEYYLQLVLNKATGIVSEKGVARFKSMIESARRDLVEVGVIEEVKKSLPPPIHEEIQWHASHVKRETLELRNYQIEIARNFLEKGSTLVVLDPSLGKSYIAVLALDAKVEEGKVIFLAPTVALVKQHFELLKKCTDLGEKVEMLTGDVASKKRMEIWNDENKRAIVATPETVRNDLMKGLADLGEVSLVIFDEAHRTTGEYAYSDIAKKAHESEKTAVLALTASPGASAEKVREFAELLGIKNIETRRGREEELKEYEKGLSRKVYKVELPNEFAEIASSLEEMMYAPFSRLEEKGLVGGAFRILPQKAFDRIQARIKTQSDEVDREASSAFAELYKLTYWYHSLLTEGTPAFLAFYEKMNSKKEQKIYATKRILGIDDWMRGKRIAEIVGMARELQEKGNPHPKIAALKMLLRARKGKNAVVFTHTVEMVNAIEKALADAGVSARKVTGKRDMSRKKLAETIDTFK
ncbi:MAG: DEAD/DEAH box helicase, partial [Candidatus Micrarchaeota archaeon]